MFTAFAFFGLVSLPSSSPASEGWQTDYSAALAEAGKEQKLVLLDFTGSDWCGWCMKLSKDIFSQPEFKEFAAKNLILVEVDFPARKPLADEVKARNSALAAN